jgi:hypothetical protein
MRAGQDAGFAVVEPNIIFLNDETVHVQWYC